MTWEPYNLHRRDKSSRTNMGLYWDVYTPDFRQRFLVRWPLWLHWTVHGCPNTVWLTYSPMSTPSVSLLRPLVPLSTFRDCLFHPHPEPVFSPWFTVVSSWNVEVPKHYRPIVGFTCVMVNGWLMSQLSTLRFDYKYLKMKFDINYTISKQ